MATVEKYKIKSGVRYSVRYMKPDGSQARKRGFLTSEAAKHWARTVELKKTSGDYVDPRLGQATVGSVADAWLAAKRSKVKPSSYAPLAAAWKNHVEPVWGHWPLGQIEISHVEDWIIDLTTDRHDDPTDPLKVTRKKYSATVVLRAHGVLAGILDRAVRDRLISTNKARAVENLPRKQPKRKIYLSHEQVDELAGYCGDWSTLVLLLAYCGLRWGEAIGLRVEDLNLLRRRIDITRSVTQVGAKFEIGTPKSGKARSVAVPVFLVELLAKQAEGKARGALLFPGPAGDWLRRPNSERGWFIAAARKLGVEELTPHDLRHTAASLAVAAGANVKAVQRMLGHESAALTLDVYADLFDDDLDTVASALDRARLRAIG